ncbi:carboxyl transferase domain-containing protein [Coxiella endosymbiont of Amblyomma americanum]|uniref:carboxyl transferase domain-containing protein n=1 Tax=Coxiella endosymbiont of Amblyomma americanum TaxID=325775 RepID=UPI00057F86EE|nr:carboxyl transferase domain-containing protein [Coxiella endosymbiont of Amblyomma americanum]AUJ58916.1 methylcrotonoyl-CoA carboxylase [Coxiella-like endosymbiont of Amblyomma americanum]
MPTIISKIKTNSKVFKNNSDAMGIRIQKLQKILYEIRQGHLEKTGNCKKESESLLVYKHIDCLLDSGSPFLELSVLAGYTLHNNNVSAGSGVVSGVGLISGQECMILANDATVNNGVCNLIGVKKYLRAQTIAKENNLPCVYLMDAGGFYLFQRDTMFPDGDFGRIFYNQARLSVQNIPQIVVLMGKTSISVNTYISAMADEVIMVKNSKFGEWENVDDCLKIGDYLAQDNEQALSLVRDIVNNLNRKKSISLKIRTPEEPIYPVKELLGLINTNPTGKSYDVREIIARLVDGSSFEEFKAWYGNTLVCGFAHIHGYPIGIIANNGIVFSQSALKGAYFVELCNRRKIPLIFLQNIIDIVDEEHKNLETFKHNAKMMHAVSCTEVPKFTIIIGSSYGVGNYVMCGRAYNPRFLFMWPNASYIKVKNEKSQFRSDIQKKYKDQLSAFYSSMRLWDDGIIDPCETRRILGLCISVSLNVSIQKTSF